MELRTGRNKRQVALLLLPGVAMFAIFTIYPIVKLFFMSFLQWDFGSMLSHSFVGLENYKAVLGDETFRIAFANTIIYTLVTVPGQMILGLMAAVFINAIPRFRVSFRVIYYIPVITSWVIVSLVFRYVFNTEGSGDAAAPIPRLADLPPAHHPRRSDNSLQPAHTSAPCVHL